MRSAVGPLVALGYSLDEVIARLTTSYRGVKWNPRSIETMFQQIRREQRDGGRALTTTAAPKLKRYQYPIEHGDYIEFAPGHVTPKSTYDRYADAF